MNDSLRGMRVRACIISGPLFLRPDLPHTRYLCG